MPLYIYIYVTPLSFSPIRIKQITHMIETNRPSHSDTKKLDQFDKITYHLLMSQLSIFQQKAERETIALILIPKKPYICHPLQ